MVHRSNISALRTVRVSVPDSSARKNITTDLKRLEGAIRSNTNKEKGYVLRYRSIITYRQIKVAFDTRNVLSAALTSVRCDVAFVCDKHKGKVT